MLQLCARAGDGTLARDVLRWMKMDGFQTTQEAYMLGIEACCTPAVRVEDTHPPAAPFAKPPPLAQPPAAPGARQASLAEEKGPGRGRVDGNASGNPVEAVAAAAAAAASPAADPLAKNGGDEVANNARGGSGGGTRVDAAAGGATLDVAERSSSPSGEKRPVAVGGAVRKQPARPSEGETEGDTEAETELFEWVAIPGGRENPPEFDKNGEEVADAAAVAAAGMGGGMVTMGGASDRHAGGGSAGGSGATAFSAAELSGQGGAAAVSAGAAWREAGGGASVSPPPAPVVAPRAGAVRVLSPAVSQTLTAREAGVSIGEQGKPRAAPPAPATGSAPAVVDAEPRSGDGGDTVNGSSGSGSGGRGSGSGGGGSGSGSGGVGSAGPAEDSGVDWQRAKAILDDMAGADHLPAPPAEAFQAVLGACDAAGRVGEALEVASAMVGVGYGPSKRLVARLMASHADALDEETREMEEAAAAPAEDWGG